MQNKLILIRHSIPNLDASVPSREWLLNEAGKEQALRLARQLATQSIDRVMSSDEPKAVETAQILGEHLGLSPEIIVGLHEQERPAPSMMPEDRYKKTIARLFSEPNNLIFGKETADEAGQRFNLAIQKLLQRFPDQGLAVVTHGTVMAMFVAIHQNRDPYLIWQRIGLPGALIFSRPHLQLITNLRPAHNLKLGS